MEKRFNVIKESKFEKLTDAEMNSVKGGLCVSCMKRDRKITIGAGAKTPGSASKETQKIVTDVQFNKMP